LFQSVCGGIKKGMWENKKEKGKERKKKRKGSVDKK